MPLPARLFAGLMAPVATGLLLASAALAASLPPNDYANPASWLCRPGHEENCSRDNSDTVLAADGTQHVEPFAPAADPPIDCFYVYPTVSEDPSGNSDMKAGPEEKQAVWLQAARFTAHCRMFAPLYRQETVASLLPRGPRTDAALAFADVRDAFHYYLANDNGGRGFVLIGHSQGATMLRRLIAAEIDGKPELRARLVSAILPGTAVGVPTGKDTGGTFQHIPLCRSPEETGCVVAFSSYAAGTSPKLGSYMGVSPGKGLDYACVNPAAPAGGAAPLSPLLPLTAEVMRDLHVKSPFLALSAALTAECVKHGPYSFLEIRLGSGAGAKVAETYMREASEGVRWGLHVLDVSLTLGSLVDLVGREAAAFAGTHPAH